MRQVAEVLPPRVFVPHHWDFWAPITAGVERGFGGASVRELLTGEGIELISPEQLFDRLEVGIDGVRAIGDGRARGALGIPERTPS